MQPDVSRVTFLIPLWPHIREEGPELLSLCLLNVSEMHFLPYFSHKKGHVFLHIGNFLLSTCVSDI